jgi:RHS repeat-associated protein
MGASIDNLSYTYDSLARVSTFGSIDGTATYGYDATNQVVSAAYTTASGGHQPANEARAYDPNGNQNGAGFTVGADNHLTSDGTFNFAFGPAGNLSTRIRISSATAADYKTLYDWDYRNRLTDVEFFNNSGTLTQHVHYAYDVLDHLIERDLDPNGGGTYTQLVHYVWDGDNIVLAFDGHQQLIARYLNGPNTSAYDQYFTTLAEEDVTSPTSEGVVTYPLLDEQGTVRDDVDANGNLLYHAVFASYGATTYESNTTTPHLLGWQGGMPDPVTGDVLSGVRWEDAAHAFWLSQDPIGLAGGDTNFSRVVRNNPTNGTDRSGLFPDSDDGDVDDALPDAAGNGNADAPDDFDDGADETKKGERFKIGQAQSRQKGLERAQAEATKQRPSVNDPDSEFDGCKKRLKQRSIEGSGKTDRRADYELNHPPRQRRPDRGGFIRIGGGNGRSAAPSQLGTGRVAAGARAAGPMLGPMAVDAGAGLIDDLTDDSLSNLLNNTIGSCPSDIPDNAIRLLTTTRAWSHIFDHYRGDLYDSEVADIDDQIEDMNEIAIDQTGNPLCPDATRSIRERLTNNITGASEE